jgi:hypothetical protein
MPTTSRCSKTRRCRQGLWENDPVVPMAAVQDPVNTIMFYDSVYKHPMDPLIDPNCPRPRVHLPLVNLPRRPAPQERHQHQLRRRAREVVPALRQDSRQVVTKNNREVDTYTLPCDLSGVPGGVANT